MKLNVKAFAVTCGLVWGLGILALAWWVILWHGTGRAVPLLPLAYRGFAFTPVGSIIGFLCAFPDGLILGAPIAWIDNRQSGGK